MDEPAGTIRTGGDIDLIRYSPDQFEAQISRTRSRGVGLDSAQGAMIGHLHPDTAGTIESINDERSPHVNHVALECRRGLTSCTARHGVRTSNGAAAFDGVGDRFVCGEYDVERFTLRPVKINEPCLQHVTSASKARSCARQVEPALCIATAR